MGGWAAAKGGCRGGCGGSSGRWWRLAAARGREEERGTERSLMIHFIVFGMAGLLFYILYAVAPFVNDLVPLPPAYQAYVSRHLGDIGSSTDRRFRGVRAACPPRVNGRSVSSRSVFVSCGRDDAAWAHGDRCPYRWACRKRVWRCCAWSSLFFAVIYMGLKDVPVFSFDSILFGEHVQTHSAK